MRIRKSREISIFTVSFLDVFANTIGGLSFLLLLAIMMVGSVVFTKPMILTETLPDGYHNQGYVQWLSAREGLGKFLWSISSGEPPKGLQLDPKTGKLSGVLELGPTDGNEKQYEFSISCESHSDEAQGDSKVERKQYVLTVRREHPVNATPLRIVTETTLPAAYRGQPYPLSFAAEGGQTPYTWSWSGGPPAGLTLGSGGQISGAPAEVGKFTFKVNVTTAKGEHLSETFSLNVSDNYPPPPPVPPLKVLTTKLPSAIADREYTVQLAAEGGSPPYTWTAVSGLPSWLTSNPGNFAGKPQLTDIGSNTVVWQVSDSNGGTVRSAPIALEVLPPTIDKPAPLKIKTLSLPEGRVGQPYLLAVSVEGGLQPYKWTYGDPNSAPGLSFSFSDGTLSGTPSHTGEFPVSVTVNDNSGRQDTTKLTIKVRPAPVPIKILTGPKAIGRVREQFQLVMSAFGGYGPYRWQLVGGELPLGLSLDENTGAISGSPERAGHWDCKLTVADAEGQTAEPLPIKLDVLTETGVRQLVIVTRSLPTLLTSQSSEVALGAEGGALPYEWRSSGSMPAGLALENGRILGTPTTSGNYLLDLQVIDDRGDVASVTLPLNIRRVTPFWLTLAIGCLATVMLAMAVFLGLGYSRRKIQPLRITTESIPNARASFDYSLQLACTGGLQPYHWSVVAGEIPPGLNLSEDGELAGCPFEGIGVDETKEVLFTVQVKDQRGTTAKQQL
jgi:large repetitive protein